MPGDRTVDLLKLLRGDQDGPGLKIVKVETTDPNPITLSFEGTKLALDLDIFEIPVSLYPLKKGDRCLAFPIVGNGTNRWGLIEKINGGLTLATMESASSLKIDGIENTYDSDALIIPPYFAVGNANSRYVDQDTDVSDGGTSSSTHYSDYYLKSTDIRPLQAGDRVSIAATLDGDKIKYVILNRY